MPTITIFDNNFQHHEFYISDNDIECHANILELENLSPLIIIYEVSPAQKHELNIPKDDFIIISFSVLSEEEKNQDILIHKDFFRILLNVLTISFEFTALLNTALENKITNQFKIEFGDNILKDSLDVQNSNGETNLILAIKNGYFNITRLLVFTKIELNTKNENGNNALMFAIKQKSLATVKLLCECGANINAQNDKGDTALIVAITTKQYDIINLLLNCGNLKVDISNKAKTNALHVACYLSLSKTTQKLLALNAPVNSKNIYGATPLILASKTNSINCVKSLLLHPDLQLNLRDNYFNTASDYASNNGHYKILKLLKDNQKKTLAFNPFNINQYSTFSYLEHRKLQYMLSKYSSCSIPRFLDIKWHKKALKKQEHTYNSIHFYLNKAKTTNLLPPELKILILSYLDIKPFKPFKPFKPLKRKR